MTAVARAPNRNAAFAAALVEELARAGVRDLALCPGSRSTPLVVAALGRRDLRLWSHLDERACAFFALGLARTSGRPVAIACTSGTAAANFLPAVVEAWHARVPLVVLTADRPPELRGWGAGQTIDQVRLFGSHVRAFVEAPVPEANPNALRYARALACRLVATAAGPPAGPVHLNLPFREPLEPLPVPGDVPPDLAECDPLAAAGRAPGAYVRVAPPAPPALDDSTVSRLAHRARGAARGVVLCGPLDAAEGFADAAVRLARAAGWPLLPDALASLRGGPHTKEAPLVAHFDALLRDEIFASAQAPELVLRFGDSPTSKALRGWLDLHPGVHEVAVDPDGVWHDPAHRAAERLACAPTAFANALASALEALPPRPHSAWTHRWLEAERRAEEALDRRIEAEPGFFEPRLVRVLVEILPEDALLFVSNSLSVREVDAFLPVSPRRLRVLGQRGANGIDGVVSAALGASAGTAAPLVLLTGDLALLHDVGGLLAAHRHSLRLPIVVVNNDGGGIFSTLPIARYGDAVGFREQFTTPHGLDLARVAALYGLGFARVGSANALRRELETALGASASTLIEVPVDAEASVAHHRTLWRAVAAEIAGAAPDGAEPSA